MLKEVNSGRVNIIGELSGLEKVIIGSGVQVIPPILLNNSCPKAVEFEERPKDSKLFIGGDWISLDNISSLTYPDCKLSFGEMPLLASRYNNVDEVQVLGEIEELGARAFEGCPLVGTVRLADGMPEIPDNAFADCSKLTYITIPNAVTRIGERAFSQCI